MGFLGKALAIVGKGPSQARLDEYHAKGVREVWTLNDCYIQGVSTRHFDIHVPLGELSGLGQSATVPFLVCDETMVGRRPNIKRYPMEAVRRHFDWPAGSEYLTTTPAYMLALALAEGVWNPIYLPGLDFDPRRRPESLWERPCVEWYMGWAAAEGIRIVVPDESYLCTANEARERRPYGVREQCVTTG